MSETMYWLNCSAKVGQDGKAILEKAIPVLKELGIDAWVEDDKE